VSKRKLRSQVGHAGYSGHSFNYTAGSDNSVVSGVTTIKGEFLPKHGDNTMKNRKNGSKSGMYFKPRTSVFYGK
jgi:hypothetical protein